MGTNVQQVTGTSEDRCSRIIIDKPKVGMPNIVFVEERLITIGTSVASREGSGILVPYDPTISFDVLDPLTNQPTGKKATYADLFQLTKSAYVAAAAARNAQAKDESNQTDTTEK